MNRGGVLRVLATLLALAAFGWLASQTEWVEEDEPAPLRGEAALKTHYAHMQLLRRLGAHVVDRPSLDQLPPPGATLVLTSSDWTLFPDRPKRLRAWVEAGGHLAIPRHLLNDEEALGWVPIAVETKASLKKAAKAAAATASQAQGEPGAHDQDKKAARASDEEDDEDDDTRDITRDADDDAPAEAPPAPPPPRQQPPRPRARSSLLPGPSPLLCEPQRERAGLDGMDDRAPMSVCGFGNDVFRPRLPAAVQWALDGKDGAEALRVSVGRGSVVVFGGWALWNNRGLLEGDNGLALVSGLGRPHAGTEVWFVVNETREQILAWVWHRAWVVVAIGLLALAAALWRGAVRFGPLLAPPPRGRRSLAEQIRGTAEFIWYRGPVALHAAQLRALDEAAARRLRGWARMDRGARAQALAEATGLPADALGFALDGRIDRPRHAWPPVLSLLEDARRRLNATSPTTSRSSTRTTPHGTEPE